MITSTSAGGRFTFTTAPAPHRSHEPLTPLRAGCRIAAFVALALGEALLWSLTVALRGRARCHRTRARWLSGFSRRLVRLFGLSVECHGRPPATGLLVCNHLSYLDIIVLAAQAPMTFLSKENVRSWPGIGLLTVLAGTLFINRERRADVARAGSEVAQVLATGAPVCLFPEGTSSDGARVLPFRPSLLEPAITAAVPITPAALRYDLPASEGDPALEVCYWGDMHFPGHFARLLGHRRIRARLVFGHPVPPGLHRKALAPNLRAEVSRLLFRDR